MGGLEFARLCRNALFTTQTPVILNQNDGVSYELGMKFQSAVAGQITAIRSYTPTSEPIGSHVGHIWDSTGNLLATATFTGETAGGGWQQQSLATPLSIQAGTTYVVSVNVVSNYVDTVGGLATSVVNGDLSSVADGQNGVFGNSGLFPTQSFNSSNYFRDVVFFPTTPHACLTLQKLVSVDGGASFQTFPNLTTPAMAQSGKPVQFQLAVTNCGNVPLTPVSVVVSTSPQTQPVLPSQMPLLVPPSMREAKMGLALS